ncbi:MAG: hypothetical protein OXG53_10870 [Chloroflexi bacterium]|nr:hypothetical protein [Chloroflexota bacterium]
MKVKNEEIYEAGFEDGYRAAAEKLGQIEPRNKAAFVIGVIIAGLFGICGMSYVLNDKVGAGCLWMFIFGPFLALMLAAYAFVSAGLGTLLVLPIWLLIVYAQAKSGASNL